MLASFKRFSDRVDRVLRDQEARGMADAAWEERLKRIEEATTVNASLIVRIEQNTVRLGGINIIQNLLRPRTGNGFNARRKKFCCAVKEGRSENSYFR